MRLPISAPTPGSLCSKDRSALVGSFYLETNPSLWKMNNEGDLVKAKRERGVTHWPGRGIEDSEGINNYTQ